MSVLTGNVANAQIITSCQVAMNMNQSNGDCPLLYNNNIFNTVSFTTGTGPGQINFADGMSGTIDQGQGLTFDLQNWTGTMGVPSQWWIIREMLIQNLATGAGNDLLLAPGGGNQWLPLMPGYPVSNALPIAAGTTLRVSRPGVGIQVAPGRSTFVLKSLFPAASPTAAPTLTAVSGGSLAAGLYSVCYTDDTSGVGGVGETAPSPIATVEVGIGGTSAIAVGGLSGQGSFVYAGIGAMQRVSFGANSYTIYSLPNGSPEPPTANNSGATGNIDYKISLYGVAYAA